MKAELHIKPEFAPFVIQPVILSTLVISLLTGLFFKINATSDLPLPPSVFFLIFIVLVGLNALGQIISFKKTSYSFYKDRIMLKTGGIFDDRTVDLQIKNITQVSVTLPYLRYLMFKTGNVSIQAAGSTGTEISLRAITNPMFVYNEVTARMQNNGFSLTREHKIQHERPGLIGTIIDLGISAVTILVTTVVVSSGVVLQLTQSNSVDSDSIRTGASAALASEFFSIILLVIFAVLLLAGVASLILYCIDLTRRNYILYDDVIDYSDGYLTQRHKFIPIENLADVTLTQSLLHRVFSISDLVVSCQGADTNIAFKVMPRADQFKNNLEGLIRDYKAQKREPDRIDLIEPNTFDANARDGRLNNWQSDVPTTQIASPQLTRITNRPALNLRLDLKRAIGGTVLMYSLPALAAILILTVLMTTVLTMSSAQESFFGGFSIGTVIIGVILIAIAITARESVQHVIAYQATQYRMNDEKIGLHHTMFNKRQVEFTVDKLTTVTVSHGIIDRFFGTATIAFHSIGTAEVITFKHLAEGRAIATDILERLGLAHGHPTKTLNPNFTTKNALVANPEIVALVVAWILFSLIVAVFYPFFLIQLLMVFALALGQLAYSEAFYKQARFELFENRLRLRQGIFVISSHYASFNHIKHLRSTQYPGSQTGTLHWTIGGGATNQLAYLENITREHEQLDTLLYAYPIKPVRQPHAFTTTILITEKPEIANNLTKLLFTSILLFPLLILLPATVPFTIIRIRRTRYTAESNRVVSTWGRMYRHRQTILYNRIDHLTTTRNALNNFFKNSSIGIATVGSSEIDLTLNDIKNHHILYDTIKQNLPTHI